MSEVQAIATLLQKEKYQFEMLLLDSDTHLMTSVIISNDDETVQRDSEIIKTNTQDSDSESDILITNHQTLQFESVKETLTAVEKHLSSEKIAEILKTSTITSECQEFDYLTSYERAERFFDEKGLIVVEPGVETKIRKHIKILTDLEPSSDHHANSPFYEGSPSLKNITGSSLFARRASLKVETLDQNPNEKSNLSQERSPASCDLKKHQQKHRPSLHPIKISRFAEKSQKNEPKEEEEGSCDSGALPANHSPKVHKISQFTEWKLEATITEGCHL